MALQPKSSFWTRKLELELVNFIKERPSIWKSSDNTNRSIQNKYRAYAEFAAKLGRGFTARSVRDRWVNLRCTFHNNLRKVNRSKSSAQSPEDVYTPCWPLWKPLQYLREASSEGKVDVTQTNSSSKAKEVIIKEESNEDFTASLRQKNKSTFRLRRAKKDQKSKCKRLLKDLVITMNPAKASEDGNTSPYWFLGRHVTSRLNTMEPHTAFCARQEILNLFCESKNVIYGESSIKIEEHELLSS